MKYTGIIARLNGEPDQSGEILSDNVEVPKHMVPVYLGFETAPTPIGMAKVVKENNSIMAEIQFSDLIVLPMEEFYGVIGGKIVSRNGNVITEWILTDIGITDKPCDLSLPKLTKVNP
jgi:hypothetical protein